MNRQFKIREATNQDSSRWDEFVNNNNGSFFQYYEWKKFYELQGHKAFFILAENSDRDILGIFPFVKTSMFLNTSIHSMPSSGRYGGPIALDEKTEDLLLDFFDNICKKERISYTYILLNPYRDTSKTVKKLLSLGFRPRYKEGKRPYTFIFKLGSSENIWKTNFSKNIRRKVRSAKRRGVEILDNQWKYLQDYYKMTLHIYKKLHNKLPLEKEFFMPFNLFDKNKIHIHIAHLNSKPIAMNCNYYTKKVCYMVGNVSISKYLSYHPNNLLAWFTIQDACNRGFEYVDFGSTAPNSSHFQWKKQYGGTPVPLQYYEKTYSPVKKFIREKTVRPRVMIRKLIWSKLVSHEKVNKMSPKMRKFLEWF